MHEIARSSLLLFSSKRVNWLDVSHATWAQYAAYCHLRLFMKTDVSPLRLDGFSKAQYGGASLYIALLSCSGRAHPLLSGDAELGCVRIRSNSYGSFAGVVLMSCDDRPQEFLESELSFFSEGAPYLLLSLFLVMARRHVFRTRQKSKIFSLHGTYAFLRSPQTQAAAIMGTSKFLTTL